MEAEKQSDSPKLGKATDKSSFSQTCSLLSKYLREKRSLGDLNIDVAKRIESATGKSEMVKSPVPAATMNLLPCIEKSSEKEAIGKDNFGLGFVVRGKHELNVGCFGIRKLSETIGSEGAEMTIFYGGRVVVFDEFTAEQAKHVMMLASKGSSHTFTGFTSTPVINQVSSERFAVPSSKIVSAPLPPPINPVRLLPPGRPYVSGLQLARRSSLNKFFEKRKKDRLAKAPYQVNSASAPALPRTSTSSFDMEAQINELELKL